MNSESTNFDNISILQNELSLYEQEKIDCCDDPEYLELVEEEIARINAEIDSIKEKIHEKVNGATFDYDFEIKRRWRQCWYDFIDEHTDESERADMKVLCLPGRLCLEIPGYLELGFKPENIIGVEGNREVKDEYERNAAQYGIKPVFGTLEDVVPKLNTPLDVVSLDFTGLCTKALLDRVISKLLLREKAVVLTNFLGARENRNLQDLYQYRKEQIDVAFHLKGQFLLPEDAYKPLDKKYKEDTFGNSPLKDIRGTVLRSFVESETGRCRSEHWLHSGTLRNLFKKVIKSNGLDCELLTPYILGLKLTDICNYLETVLKNIIDRTDVIKFLLYFLCEDSLLRIPVTKAIKKYKYVSRNGSPFVSDMFAHEAPTQVYEQCNRTVNFIYNYLLALVYSSKKLKEAEKAYFIPIAITDHFGIPVLNRDIRNLDKLEFTDGGMLHSLPIRILLRDLETYKQLLHNVPYKTEADYPELDLIKMD